MTRQLLPLATQQTRRTPYVVHTTDGEPAASRSSTTSSPSPRARRRERSTERSKSRCSHVAELLEPVVAVLTAAGAEPSASQSKGIRSLVGDAALPALIEIGERPRPKDPAADAVGYHVRTQVSAILKQDQRIRRHLPDSVHQYRVAARRLRSVPAGLRPSRRRRSGRATCAPSSAGSPPCSASPATVRCSRRGSSMRCEHFPQWPTVPRRSSSSSSISTPSSSRPRHRSTLPWHRPATAT